MLHAMKGMKKCKVRVRWAGLHKVWQETEIRKKNDGNFK